MKTRMTSRWTTMPGLLALLLLGGYVLGHAANDPPVDTGPDVVVLDHLKEVEDLYDPVPFDHKMHASMAQMAGGCETCHHHSPRPEPPKDKPFTKDQGDSVRHPACRTCHEVKRVDLRQPGLKGAIHRQCLNCHRDWAAENACVACHEPKGKNGMAKQVTKDDILGRMHPPIPEPETTTFKAKFTPADGPNVLFRHKQHIERFDIKCVTCHQEENCSRCHATNPNDRTRAAKKNIGLDRAWGEVHARCSSCHKREEKCSHCHFKDDQSAPQPFEHSMTGQVLDKDHMGLSCGSCHTDLTKRGQPTCGTADCHKSGAVSFPDKRPGPVVPLEKARPRAGGMIKTAVSIPGATAANATSAVKKPGALNAGARDEVNP